MENLQKTVLSSPSLHEFSDSFAAVCRSVPSEIKDRLKTILTNYFATHGMKGAYERMNNRTVAQILDEYRPGQVKLVKSGQQDGTRYELYRRPSPLPNAEQEKGTT